MVSWAATLAAARLSSQQHPFDALLCDLNLPDGTAIELLGELRPRFARLGPRGELPAIVMSGSVEEESLARCREAGYSVHLTKPFDRASLMDAFRQVSALLD